MSKQLMTVLTLVAIIALTGCSSSNTTENSSDNSGGLLSGLTGPKFYTSDDLDALDDKACDVLSKDMVAKYAPGKSDSDIMQITIVDCIYTWDKSNIAEIEARNDAKIAGATLAELTSGALDTESTENRIALLYTYSTYSPPRDETALDNAFRAQTNMISQEERDAANQAIRDAMNSLGQDNELTSQAQETADDLNLGEGVQEKIEEGFNDQDKAIGGTLLDAIQAEAAKQNFQEVSGVGDRAAWDDYSKTLVVQYNNFLFSLEVDLEDTYNNQEAAIELGQEVLANFQDLL